MLYLFVRCFSYTPDIMFIREEFLLHTLFVRSFFYTPDATFSEEFVLPSSC